VEDVWVECVEHTPQLHMKGGGEKRGTHAFKKKESFQVTWEMGDVFLNEMHE
jgi:hypothetical protein